MADEPENVNQSDGTLAGRRAERIKIVLRVIWMAIQIAIVLWAGESGVHFLYQGF